MFTTCYCEVWVQFFGNFLEHFLVWICHKEQESLFAHLLNYAKEKSYATNVIWIFNITLLDDNSFSHSFSCFQEFFIFILCLLSSHFPSFVPLLSLQSLLSLCSSLYPVWRTLHLWAHNTHRF
jgi:hypothetical protein